MEDALFCSNGEERRKKIKEFNSGHIKLEMLM